ncbi:site-specific integrase [Pseudomonas juntendi]|uniref:site-specific integrase n=1 Tax=Pseudomonas juntendi TaxID=2666183 RepID=UPI00301A421F
MSVKESILFTPARATVEQGAVTWDRVRNSTAIADLPQLFWGDGEPWREANLWLMLEATTGQKPIETVKSKAYALLEYCKWLERTQTNWWDFPPIESDRCLVKYHGYLRRQLRSGTKTNSTCSQRMQIVIQFYRWLRAQSLLTPEWPMWKEKFFNIKFNNSFGLERTLTVSSTSLSIPNRKSNSLGLEEGLYPVSNTDRDKILELALKYCPYEIYLLLMVGFFTGMRIQTISGLTIETLESAVQDPASEDLYRIAVGPGARPPVPTKNSVTGHVWITKPLLDELRKYCYSTTRLLREVKAEEANKNLVFLTKRGNPYADRSRDSSPAINVAMHSLRNLGLKHGVSALQKFKFHQTRCTFATELARLAIKAGGAIHAIAIVKDALLHKNEETSIRYIKFIERNPIKVAMANEFTKSFFNAASIARV